MKKYYLAYGSNLNLDQMKWRCPDAIPVGVAKIKDYQLLFKGSKSGSYLTIEKQKGSFVPVAIWQVSESDESSLDVYEGYPSFYYKKEIALTYEDISSGKKEKCRGFIYIMHEDRNLGMPTRRYVQTCIKGYQDFGFDIKILEKALIDSWEEMS